MRKAGLTKSKRGASGGHFLAKPASEITLLDITDLMEGGLYLMDCCNDSSETCQVCPRYKTCIIRSTWQKVNYTLTNELDKITLAEILKGNGHHE